MTSIKNNVSPIWKADQWCESDSLLKLCDFHKEVRDNAFSKVFFFFILLAVFQPSEVLSQIVIELLVKLVKLSLRKFVLVRKFTGIMIEYLALLVH